MPDDDDELTRALYALPYRRDGLPRSSQVVSAAIGRPYRQELLQIQRDSPKASGLIAQLETSGVDHKDYRLDEDGVLMKYSGTTRVNGLLVPRLRFYIPDDTEAASIYAKGLLEKYHADSALPSPGASTIGI
ncbi:hypothetical protein Pmar_PMAR016258 [Perkinsus marinus ATCC 50983]|nr:hypothetical protein Pmar_PMAR016258 [Perkinsus marinus ATCC 50983]EER10410.1 hypothetical protein Pmar_PMAR016258 [Perkinsus marinus ATCC 50983]|eukprot:XP_002778615.1 hypothetical protein Pmar_PMAR016258 [Perkinsus marinus ATCC 50983]